MARTNPDGRIQARTDAKTHAGTHLRMLLQGKFQMQFYYFRRTVVPNYFKIHS